MISRCRNAPEKQKPAFRAIFFSSILEFTWAEPTSGCSVGRNDVQTNLSVSVWIPDQSRTTHTAPPGLKGREGIWEDTDSRLSAGSREGVCLILKEDSVALTYNMCWRYTCTPAEKNRQVFQREMDTDTDTTMCLIIKPLQGYKLQAEHDIEEKHFDRKKSHTQ